jgi:Na+-transporting NADH:ubiquinone oxidoreductase subunit F
MTTIVMGVGMFTGVILALVGLLLVARSRLVATGEVRIVVNGDESKAIVTRAGGTLLGTLADQRIFIPSACGGKGTCGVCTAKVLEGGGAVLPTERSHITRGEEREGVRLTCQVKVKSDMRIELPPEIFSVKEWECTVRSNTTSRPSSRSSCSSCPRASRCRSAPAATSRSKCPPHVVKYEDFDVEDEYRGDWDKFNMWRYVSTVDEPVSRAYSMANYPEERGIIMLNVRIASPPPRAPEHVPPGKPCRRTSSI